MNNEKILKTSDWKDVTIFKGHGSKLDIPILTILKTNRLCFNKYLIASLEKIPTHVILAYSESKKAIIFKFEGASTCVHAMCLYSKDNSYNCGALGFFTSHKMKASECQGRYGLHFENIPKIGRCWVSYLGKKYE